MKISKFDELKNLNVPGTQSKWKIGDYWYKIDDFNHEGLSETIVAEILKNRTSRN